MRFYLSLFATLFVATLTAQTSSIATFDPDDILLTGEPRPQVLLVGTFHMDYPNLDAHVTDAADQVDVKDAKRSTELRELLDYISRFKPTQIVVERWPESNENDKYRSYLAGERELERSEVQQLGFRLGKRFGIEELILADAGTLVRSLSNDSTLACLQPTLDAMYQDWDFTSDAPLSQRYTELYETDNELLQTSTLLEFFKYENSPHRIRRGHGAYLVGDFELGDRRGADALALHWYARNLRIYRNIQKAITSPDDRVLVIFGAGHLGILRQQFESSPEFELVDFGDLEK